MQSKKTEHKISKIILSAVIVLLGAVLFSSKTNASVVYDNSEPPTTGLNSTPGNQYYNGVSFRPTTTLNIRYFSAALVTSCDHCTGQVTLYTLQTNTGSWWSTVATSDTQNITSGFLYGTSTFAFSNILTLQANQWYSFAIKTTATSSDTFIGLNTQSTTNQLALEYDTSGHVVYNPVKAPVFSLADDSGFPTVTNNNLSFTDPTQDDKVLSPPSFVGTCDSSYTPLTLQIIPEPCYFGTSYCNEQSNYKDIVIAPISCIGNTWTYSGVTLTPLRYEAKIQDTSYATATVDFWITNLNGWLGPGSTAGFSNGTTTPKCSNVVNWSCSNALIGDVCANGAVVVNEVTCYAYSLLAAQENAFQHTKPYSYAWQLYDAYQSLTEPTTSTSTFPSYSVKTGSATTTIFSQSSIINSHTEPILLALRPYGVLAIQLAFVGFIILWFAL